MYHHLIMSRKEQSNKKKLSPLTNHKNTKNGTIKGTYDPSNLIKHPPAAAAEEEAEDAQADEEDEFAKLFNYNRQSIQNLLITTFNEKWFCNRIT